MPAETRPDRETIASKIFSLLHAGVDAELRYGTIAIVGSRHFEAIVNDGIGIFSNAGACVELLPQGLTYQQIAEHISGIALGTTTGALEGSDVIRASGSGWVTA